MLNFLRKKMNLIPNGVTISAGVITIILGSIQLRDYFSNDQQHEALKNKDSESSINSSYKDNAIHSNLTSHITFSDYMKLLDNEAGLSQFERDKILFSHDSKIVSWVGIFESARARGKLDEDYEIELIFRPENRKPDVFGTLTKCVVPRAMESSVVELVEGEKIKCTGKLASEGLAVLAEDFLVIP